MNDREENAAIVNAIQRRATVIVQKSLAEGFGLTVTEAMWKGRPLVASNIGAIPDQIDSGKEGLLVDPNDYQAFGKAVRTVLEDPTLAASLGQHARAKATSEFLPNRHLEQYAELIEKLLA